MIISNPECDICQWLSHFEYDEKEGKHCLPRCAIEFRNGAKIEHPCIDFKPRKKQAK